MDDATGLCLTLPASIVWETSSSTHNRALRVLLHGVVESETGEGKAEGLPSPNDPGKQHHGEGVIQLCKLVCLHDVDQGASMATMIRVSPQTHEQIQKLAEARNEPIGKIVSDAVELLDAEQFWAEVDAAYDRLRSDPDAWNEYMDEICRMGRRDARRLGERTAVLRSGRRVSSGPQPQRGDVWDADLDPAIGHEQGKRRPVLVVSTDRFNVAKKRSLHHCRLDRDGSGLPFHVRVEPPEGGLSRAFDGPVRADPHRILYRRLRRYRGRVSAQPCLRSKSGLRRLLDV